MVFVLGDHGMTEDGNHGGATPEETGAALLIWSRSAERLLGPAPPVRNIGGERRGKGAGGGAGEGTGGKEDAVLRNHPVAGRKVAQIDLVPTVSLLLGTPIPFGSLGGVIPEVFGGSYLNDAGVGGDKGERDGRGEAGEADPRYYERLCDALLVNSVQVRSVAGAGGRAGCLIEAWPARCHRIDMSGLCCVVCTLVVALVVSTRCCTC